MQQSAEKTDCFVPDGNNTGHALGRTTHLAIAAHQDDIEIIGFHGIAECFGHDDRWFTGIVITDGANSPRSGVYAHYSDDEMAEIRKREQRQAAELGQYSLVLQCGAASAELKNGINSALVERLTRWLALAQPQIVYLHNLADRHQTHSSVCLHALEALRALGAKLRPQQVLGVEVWRSLDWLPEQYRLRLDVSAQRLLYMQLIAVFDSQISAGKRYDLASDARHLCNATFDQSHAVDGAGYLSLAMNLMPLVANPELEYQAFMATILRQFEEDLSANLPTPMQAKKQ